MDRLDAMRTFLLVADRSSFAEAARAARVSPAAATRAVVMLEQELGLALLSRTTRSVRLTERGALYADRCRRILAELDDARRLVRGDDAAPRGLLSVTAPVLFGRLHVMPIVEALLNRNEGLSVRCTFVDRVTHLVEEGFDLAVRIGALSDSALIAVAVAEVRRVLVASAEYIEANGEPSVPADLKDHRIVAFEGISSTDDWRFGADGKVRISVTPRLSVNSADAAIASAIRGQGIARMLSYQVSDAVADGRLRRLLPMHEPAPMPVSLVYQPDRRGSPNIAAFVKAARAYFAEPRWA